MSEWWKPSTPDAIGAAPWMHPASVLYLESLLTPDMTVIEHGCGASTIWFAKRVKHVTAYDEDGDWIQGLRMQTKDYANIRLVPLENVPETQYRADLLLIDGYNHDRPRWLKEAQRLIKPGGIIVLDNAERPHYRAGRDHLLKFCYPPCAITATTAPPLSKFVVTEFYRVKGGQVQWI